VIFEKGELAEGRCNEPGLRSRGIMVEKHDVAKVPEKGKEERERCVAVGGYKEREMFYVGERGRRADRGRRALGMAFAGVGRSGHLLKSRVGPNLRVTERGEKSPGGERGTC